MTELLLRVALFIAVLNIPGMHYPYHLALLAFYNVVPAGTPAYNHRRYFWAALYALSEALLKAQVAAIQNSPVIALMMDSGTDITKDEHILIYVQYLVIAPSAFKVVCQYLCTIAVAEKTALCIYDTLKQVLQALGLHECRIAAFCADGGSEYAGKINGVGKKLQRNETGWLLRMHCFAHRAALVMNDQTLSLLFCNVNDKFTLHDVDKLLRDVHGLFAHSGPRKKRWAKYIKKRKLELCVRFPIFNATRWFSRAVCLEALVKALPELIHFLTLMNKRKKPWDPFVLDRLRNPDMVALLMCLTDIVGSVNIFNQQLQKDGLLVPEAFEHVAKIQTRLHAFFTYGPSIDMLSGEPLPTGINGADSRGMANFSNFLNTFDAVTGKWQYTRRMSVKLELCRAHLLGWNAIYAITFAKGIVEEICTSLDARFPMPGYVRALKVLHPKAWLGIKTGDAMPPTHKAHFRALLAFYSLGPNEVFKLAKQDKANPAPRAQDIAKYMAEAQVVADLLSDLVNEHNTISMLDAWKIIFRNHALKVPNFITVAFSVLVCPVHSAAVERGFSIHRVLKHRLTSRLLLTTLDSAMRVKMLVHKDEIFTYDSTDAITVYEESHPRNSAVPRLLASLHQAVDEAANLPDKLSDGVDYGEIGIDVATESEDDLSYDPADDDDNSSDDDEDWEVVGLDFDDQGVSSDADMHSDDVPVVEMSGSDADE